MKKIKAKQILFLENLMQKMHFFLRNKQVKGVTQGVPKIIQKLAKLSKSSNPF